MLINAIKSRVEERIKNGALEEVENLLKQGYNEQDPGLRTIGYTQIIQYLKKQISWETTISQWITKEVQYAKRQMTFMKKDRHIRWIEIG
jgi:tRNA dimethylallyltransferase